MTRALVLLAAAAGLATQAWAQMGGGFGGPSVMGRGAQAGRRGGQSVRLRGFVAGEGIYDSGLTTINSNGITTAAGAGAEVRWGAYGNKSQRRSALGLDYQGDYRHYNTSKLWNGSSQTLSLSYSMQTSRRTNMEVAALAGSTNRAFGVNTGGLGAGNGASGFGANALNQSILPTTSLFDLRTNYLGGMGGLTVVHSARLSSSYNASGFTVRRRSRLPGVDGMIGRADVSYRIGRRSSLGVDLNYYKFDYTNAFGDTNILEPGVLFSSQVGRNVQFGVRLGVMRVESFGTRQVSLEPEIAALLGVAQTSEIFYLKTYVPTGTLEITRSFKRSSISARGIISPNPGNGLLYASRQATVVLNATHQFTRRLQFSAAGQFTRLRSVTSLAAAYEQYTFGGGMSYKLSRSIELISRLDRRVAQLDSVRTTALNGTRFTAGIAFSPSDVPLQLW